mmetsp:Transcript_117910/g.241025  ORF Transcript_117910/g.241025 Transcript_117910/m.241025 type:complete len:203 (-) Transcript_117910:287-895(-)
MATVVTRNTIPIAIIQRQIAKRRTRSAMKCRRDRARDAGPVGSSATLDLKPKRLWKQTNHHRQHLYPLKTPHEALATRMLPAATRATTTTPIKHQQSLEMRIRTVGWKRHPKTTANDRDGDNEPLKPTTRQPVWNWNGRHRLPQATFESLVFRPPQQEQQTTSRQQLRKRAIAIGRTTQTMATAIVPTLYRISKGSERTGYR